MTSKRCAHWTQQVDFSQQQKAEHVKYNVLCFALRNILSNKLDMKKVFRLCFQPDAREIVVACPKKTFKVTPVMQLETYGRIDKTKVNRERNKGQKKNIVIDTSHNTMTQETNASNKTFTKINKNKHEIKLENKHNDESHKSRKQSKRETKKRSNSKSGKREIAIQAGSPLLNTKDQKTRTTLLCSQQDGTETSKPLCMQKPLLKNPWNVHRIKDEVQPEKKIKLGPVKKGILTVKHTATKKKKGDSILEPLDKAIIEKNKKCLVPVDRDFIRRLEKENSLLNAETHKESRNKTKKATIRTSTTSIVSDRGSVNPHSQLSLQSQLSTQHLQEQGESVEESDDDREDTECSKMEENEKQNVLQITDQHTGTEKTMDARKKKNRERRRTYGENYDSDELELIEEIEKEFAEI